MKITINNVYADSYDLFESNEFLTNDARLTDFVDLFPDMDLVTENSYGNRELYNAMLTHNEGDYEYDLYKLHRAVYSVFVENLTRYKLLLKADTAIEDYDPLTQYKEKTTHGERVKTDEFGSRVNTTTHGNKTTTTNVGQSTDTSTAGARTAEQSVTSFSTDTYHPTSKTEEPQTIDSMQYGARQDTQNVVQADDTNTAGAHTDTFREYQSIDYKEGYKDGGKEIERLRSYATQNTLKEIVNDVVNHISYGMYLF